MSAKGWPARKELGHSPVRETDTKKHARGGATACPRIRWSGGDETS